MDDFERLMKSQDSLHAAAAADSSQNKRTVKRYRPEDDGTPFFVTIADALYNIWLKLSLNEDTKRIDIARVEVEVRIGHVLMEQCRRWKAQTSKKHVCLVPEGRRTDLGLSFKAGVDEIYVEHLKRVLGVDKFSVEQKPLQKLRCDVTGGHRWEVDASNKVTAVESKNRFFRQDYALLSHQYDIRIDAATEDPSNLPATTTTSSSSSSSASAGHDNPNPIRNLDEWSMERLKRRRTYRSKNPELNAWKIDLTEVDIRMNKAQLNGTGSNNNGGVAAGAASGVREMELEFELENAPMQSWLRETDKTKGDPPPSCLQHIFIPSITRALSCYCNTLISRLHELIKPTPHPNLSLP